MFLSAFLGLSVCKEPLEIGKVHLSGFCPPPAPITVSALVYLYVDIGRVLDLQVRVQTVRRSSFPPFIQAAVPGSLMKAPPP